MRKAKVLLNFIWFPVAVKIMFYYHVIAELTGNSLFSEPDDSSFLIPDMKNRTGMPNCIFNRMFHVIL
jgi:hypothetical protein